jgi:Tfp pilus assembly protein PilF
MVIGTFRLFSAALYLCTAQLVYCSGRANQETELLQQAEADVRLGQLDAALAKCQTALKADPDSALAHYLSGLAYSLLGDSQKARESAKNALSIDPSLLTAHLLLGRIDIQSGLFDEAVSEFRTAVAGGDDRDFNGRYGLGLALLKQGKYEEAYAPLGAAADRKPKDPARLYALISTQLELNRGDVKERLVQFEDASPRPEILYRLGLLLLHHRRPQEAESEFRRAAILVEGSRASPLPATDVAGLYVALAKLRFERKDYKQASAFAEKVPTARLSLATEVDLSLLAGQSLIALGRTEEGFEKLKQAVQKTSTDEDALLRAAWAAVLLNRPMIAREFVAALEAKWPQTEYVAQIRALVERETLAPRPAVPFTQDWHLKGEGFVCCPCKSPCPCRHNARPSQPHCEATGAYKISRGHYGNVPLDGFTFVLVDANMTGSNFPSQLFVDQRATDQQVIALERIYQAFGPLHPFIFPAVVRRPISFKSQSGIYEVSIPQRVELKIERHALGLTAALDPFSNLIEYVQNVTYKVWDESNSIRWDYSGRQANFRPIDLDARDYLSQSMLSQFQDSSGDFNAEQKEIIKRFDLPALPLSGAFPPTRSANLAGMR